MTEETQSRQDQSARLVRNSVILLAGVVGVSLLLRLVLIRNYDYDEISHAHMAWLLSIGDKPYQDFVANHFPFFWVSLSPLMRVLPQSPLGLVLLRLLALALNAIFVGALGTLICLELQPRQRIWGAVCLGVVVLNSPVIHFLIEFRPDALANALLFPALLWLRLRGPQHPGQALLGGFVIGVAVLVNTKYLFFPVVLGAVLLAMHLRQLRKIWPLVLAICLGFCMALLSGILVVDSMRISIGDAWRMVVNYNGAVEKSQNFGFGLADALIHNNLSLLYIMPGFVLCTIMFARRKWIPKHFEIAIVAFLALDLVWCNS